MSPSGLLLKTSRLGQAVRRLAPLVLALGLLTGVLRGGTRYFYCPAMKAVMGAVCCGAKHAAADSDAERATVHARDCCEERVQGRLPVASTHGGITVVDAPLLAILPAITGRDLPSTIAPQVRSTHEVRAGPRSSAQRRAELMVFLN